MSNSRLERVAEANVLSDLGASLLASGEEDTGLRPTKNNFSYLCAVLGLGLIAKKLFISK